MTHFVRTLPHLQRIVVGLACAWSLLAGCVGEVRPAGTSEEGAYGRAEDRGTSGDAGADAGPIANAPGTGRPGSGGAADPGSENDAGVIFADAGELDAATGEQGEADAGSGVDPGPPKPRSPADVIGLGIATGGDTMALSPEEWAAQLDDMKRIGVRYVRVDISWDSVMHKGPSSYDWTPVDMVMSAIRAHGMKALGMIGYSPPWARPRGTAAEYPPNDPAQYGDFAAKVAERYGPLGHKYWEIWNEPNGKYFWAPGADAVQYAKILKAAYRAIKAVDPEAAVILAGLSPAVDNPGVSVSPARFLAKLYEVGCREFFDAAAIHPYAAPNLPSQYATWSTWSQMSETPLNLRSVMVANDDADKKIWLTEMGMPTSGATYETSERVQAQALSEAAELLRTYPWAGPMFWYEYRDSGPKLDYGQHNFGLTRVDGTPKRSYAVYRDLPKSW